MKYLILALCLCACAKPHTPEVVIKTPSQVVTSWEDQYTEAANMFVSLTSDCISEMYSLKYYPVNAGPDCKKACDQLHKVNSLVDNSPVVGTEKYRIEDNGSVCVKRTGKK